MKKNKRLFAVGLLIMLLFCGLGARLVFLAVNLDGTEQAAGSTHGSYSLRLGEKRGTIYDTNLHPLVNETNEYLAVVSPAKDAARQLAALLPHVLNEETFFTLARQGKPYAVRVNAANISAEGVKVASLPVRYADQPLAPHIVGYINSDGDGVSGLEKAYDSLLKEGGGAITANVAVDALGRTLPGVQTVIAQNTEGQERSLVLTIDRNIQLAAQEACKKYLKSGAAVVMDAKTGDILACESVPEYSQQNVAKSVSGANSPLLNRAFSAYDLGSIFKICLAASALESGISPSLSYDCTGKIDVAGKNFNCHKLTGHGVQDMAQALSNSCNTYYINLGRMLGGEKILNMAGRLGFGKTEELAPGVEPSGGVMPTAQALQVPAALANFSMGQGDFMASPIQVARMMCAVANGGMLPGARIVKGIADGQGKILQAVKADAPTRAFSKEISDQLIQFLIETVDVGTGTPAKPAVGGAGGKTATAQTGWKVNGVLINQAWFAGFYPAQSPRYVIVVLSENGEAGGTSAGPVFKDIADYLAPYCGLVSAGPH